MEEILDELPLSNALKAALLNREGKLGSVLKAVLAYEAGLPISLADLGIDVSRLADAYVDAVTWTDSLFEELSTYRV